MGPTGASHQLWLQDGTLRLVKAVTSLDLQALNPLLEAQEHKDLGLFFVFVLMEHGFSQRENIACGPSYYSKFNHFET